MLASLRKVAAKKSTYVWQQFSKRTILVLSAVFDESGTFCTSAPLIKIAESIPQDLSPLSIVMAMKRDISSSISGLRFTGEKVKASIIPHSSRFSVGTRIGSNGRIDPVVIDPDLREDVGYDFPIGRETKARLKEVEFLFAGSAAAMKRRQEARQKSVTTKREKMRHAALTFFEQSSLQNELMATTYQIAERELGEDHPDVQKLREVVFPDREATRAPTKYLDANQFSREMLTHVESLRMGLLLILSSDKAARAMFSESKLSRAVITKVIQRLQMSHKYGMPVFNILTTHRAVSELILFLSSSPTVKTDYVRRLLAILVPLYMALRPYKALFGNHKLLREMVTDAQGWRDRMSTALKHARLNYSLHVDYTDAVESALMELIQTVAPISIPIPTDDSEDQPIVYGTNQGDSFWVAYNTAQTVVDDLRLVHHNRDSSSSSSSSIGAKSEEFANIVKGSAYVIKGATALPAYMISTIASYNRHLYTKYRKTHALFGILTNVGFGLAGYSHVIRAIQVGMGVSEALRNIWDAVMHKTWTTSDRVMLGLSGGTSLVAWIGYIKYMYGITWDNVRKYVPGIAQSQREFALNVINNISGIPDSGVSTYKTFLRGEAKWTTHYSPDTTGVHIKEIQESIDQYYSKSREIYSQAKVLFKVMLDDGLDSDVDTKMAKTAITNIDSILSKIGNMWGGSSPKLAIAKKFGVDYNKIVTELKKPITALMKNNLQLLFDKKLPFYSGYGTKISNMFWYPLGQGMNLFSGDDVTVGKDIMGIIESAMNWGSNLLSMGVSTSGRLFRLSRDRIVYNFGSGLMWMANYVTGIVGIEDVGEIAYKAWEGLLTEGTVQILGRVPYVLFPYIPSDWNRNATTDAAIRIVVAPMGDSDKSQVYTYSGTRLTRLHVVKFSAQSDPQRGVQDFISNMSQSSQVSDMSQLSDFDSDVNERIGSRFPGKDTNIALWAMVGAQNLAPFHLWFPSGVGEWHFDSVQREWYFIKFDEDYEEDEDEEEEEGERGEDVIFINELRRGQETEDRLNAIFNKVVIADQMGHRIVEIVDRHVNFLKRESLRKELGPHPDELSVEVEMIESVEKKAETTGLSRWFGAAANFVLGRVHNLVGDVQLVPPSLEMKIGARMLSEDDPHEKHKFFHAPRYEVTETHSLASDMVMKNMRLVPGDSLGIIFRKRSYVVRMMIRKAGYCPPPAIKKLAASFKKTKTWTMLFQYATSAITLLQNRKLKPSEIHSRIGASGARLRRMYDEKLEEMKKKGEKSISVEDLRVLMGDSVLEDMDEAHARAYREQITMLAAHEVALRGKGMPESIAEQQMMIGYMDETVEMIATGMDLDTGAFEAPSDEDIAQIEKRMKEKSLLAKHEKKIREGLAMLRSIVDPGKNKKRYTDLFAGKESHHILARDVLSVLGNGEVSAEDEQSMIVGILKLSYASDRIIYILDRIGRGRLSTHKKWMVTFLGELASLHFFAKNISDNVKVTAALITHIRRSVDWRRSWISALRPDKMTKHSTSGEIQRALARLFVMWVIPEIKKNVDLAGGSQILTRVYEEYKELDSIVIKGAQRDALFIGTNGNDDDDDDPDAVSVVGDAGVWYISDDDSDISDDDSDISDDDSEFYQYNVRGGLEIVPRGSTKVPKKKTGTAHPIKPQRTTLGFFTNAFVPSLSEWAPFLAGSFLKFFTGWVSPLLGSWYMGYINALTVYSIGKPLVVMLNLMIRSKAWKTNLKSIISHQIYALVVRQYMRQLFSLEHKADAVLIKTLKGVMGPTLFSWNRTEEVKKKIEREKNRNGIKIKVKNEMYIDKFVDERFLLNPGVTQRDLENRAVEKALLMAGDSIHDPADVATFFTRLANWFDPEMKDDKRLVDLLSQKNTDVRLSHIRSREATRENEFSHPTGSGFKFTVYMKHLKKLSTTFAAVMREKTDKSEAPIIESLKNAVNEISPTTGVWARAKSWIPGTAINPGTFIREISESECAPLSSVATSWIEAKSRETRSCKVKRSQEETSTRCFSVVDQKMYENASKLGSIFEESVISQLGEDTAGFEDFNPDIELVRNTIKAISGLASYEKDRQPLSDDKFRKLVRSTDVMKKLISMVEEGESEPLIITPPVMEVIEGIENEGEDPRGISFGTTVMNAIHKVNKKLGITKNLLCSMDVRHLYVASMLRYNLLNNGGDPESANRSLAIHLYKIKKFFNIETRSELDEDEDEDEDELVVPVTRSINKFATNYNYIARGVNLGAFRVKTFSAYLSYLATGLYNPGRAARNWIFYFIRRLFPNARSGKTVVDTITLLVESKKWLDIDYVRGAVKFLASKPSEWIDETTALVPAGDGKPARLEANIGSKSKRKRKRDIVGVIEKLGYQVLINAFYKTEFWKQTVFPLAEGALTRGLNGQLKLPVHPDDTKFIRTAKIFMQASNLVAITAVRIPPVGLFSRAVNATGFLFSTIKEFAVEMAHAQGQYGIESRMSIGDPLRPRDDDRQTRITINAAGHLHMRQVVKSLDEIFVVSHQMDDVVKTMMFRDFRTGKLHRGVKYNLQKSGAGHQRIKFDIEGVDESDLTAGPWIVEYDRKSSIPWKNTYDITVPINVLEGNDEVSNITVVLNAIIKNPGPEDWDNVHLTLSTANPHTVHDDLYQPKTLSIVEYEVKEGEQGAGEDNHVGLTFMRDVIKTFNVGTVNIRRNHGEKIQIANLPAVMQRWVVLNESAHRTPQQSISVKLQDVSVDQRGIAVIRSEDGAFIGETVVHSLGKEKKTFLSYADHNLIRVDKRVDVGKPMFADEDVTAQFPILVVLSTVRFTHVYDITNYELDPSGVYNLRLLHRVGRDRKFVTASATFGAEFISQEYQGNQLEIRMSCRAKTQVTVTESTLREHRYNFNDKDDKKIVLNDVILSRFVMKNHKPTSFVGVKLSVDKPKKTNIEPILKRTPRMRRNRLFEIKDITELDHAKTMVQTKRIKAELRRLQKRTERQCTPKARLISINHMKFIKRDIVRRSMIRKYMLYIPDRYRELMINDVFNILLRSEEGITRNIIEETIRTLKYDDSNETKNLFAQYVLDHESQELKDRVWYIMSHDIFVPTAMRTMSIITKVKSSIRENGPSQFNPPDLPRNKWCWE